MIILTGAFSSNRLAVMADYVDLVEQDTAGSTRVRVGDETFWVKESFDEVVEAIERELQK